MKRAGQPISWTIACVALLGCVVGCSDYLATQDMHVQPVYKTFQQSDFFGDKLSARQVVPGTVARGQLQQDDALYRGQIDGKFVEEVPIELTATLLERGRERYDIYCAVCHDTTGYGNGIVVQRGFPRPQSLHSDRLRAAPPGYFFDVITNGMGKMAGQSVQLETKDRWAIVSYVRAFQLSQHSVEADSPTNLPETPSK